MPSRCRAHVLMRQVPLFTEDAGLAECLAFAHTLPRIESDGAEAKSHPIDPLLGERAQYPATSVKQLLAGTSSNSLGVGQRAGWWECVVPNSLTVQLRAHALPVPVRVRYWPLQLG